MSTYEHLIYLKALGDVESRLDKILKEESNTKSIIDGVKRCKNEVCLMRIRYAIANGIRIAEE